MSYMKVVNMKDNYKLKWQKLREMIFAVMHYTNKLEVVNYTFKSDNGPELGIWDYDDYGYDKFVFPLKMINIKSIVTREQFKACEYVFKDNL